MDQAFAAGLAREVALHITMSMSALSHVRTGVADGFIRHIGLAGLGLGRRAFGPSIMLPVALMTPGTGAVPHLAQGFTRSLAAGLGGMRV